MNLDILVIEPSKELAQILGKALKRRGLKPRLAANAQKGIHLADKQTPDLVIMELIMPSHNGVEFIHEFRSYPEWFNVPIIIYSNVAPSELDLDKKTMDDLGLAGHLYKPTASLDELLATVESSFAPIDN